MNIRFFLLSLMTAVIWLCPMDLSAQKISVTGKVTESSTGEALPGAAAALLNPKDSSIVTGATTDNNGKFSIAPKRGGEYILRISYMGFKTITRNLKLKRDSKATDLGTISMAEDAKMLKEANVVARMAQVEMKADTFVFNADAFRMPEGAVLEELVKKLPGVEVAEDGTITHNGKTIKKIMVDGKEFFGNDTKMSMKNIPTKMIKNVKAYERQSDYSRVTGIDDGEEESVLALTVKKGMKKGWMINLEAGYGTKDRYTAKANVMHMQDNKQIAAFLSTNNINDRSMGGGGRWMRGGSGIVSSQMGGANMAWENGKGEREGGLLKLGGYVNFFRTFSDSVTRSNSETFLQGASSTWNNSLSQGDNLSWSLNASFRMEWMPDSMTNIIFRPSFSHSQGRSESGSSSVSFDGDPYEAGMNDPLEEFSDTVARPELKNILINSNINNALSQNHSNSGNAFLQINRRLGRPGRNVTLNLRGSYSHSESKSWNISDIKYYKTQNRTYTNRFNERPGTNYNIDTKLSYTEPLTRYMNLQASYQFQYRFQDSNRSMYDLHCLMEDIGLPDYMPFTPEDLYMGYIPGLDTLALIRNFENSQYATYNEYNHDAQLLLRYTRKFENKQELRFNAGVSFQPQTTHMDYAKHTLDTTVVRNTFNWAPRINARWKINDGSQLRLRYNGRMSQPSMTSLLEIMDNSDPQNVSLGNAGLESSWTNSVNLDYNAYLAPKQMGWAARASYSGTDRSVSTATIYDASTGNRYTRPMNIDGNWNTRLFLMFNTALDTAKHFNIHTSTNLQYSNHVEYISSAIDDMTTPATVEDMQNLFKSVSERGLLNKATTKELNLSEYLRLGYRTEWGSTGSVDVGLHGGFTYRHARNQSNINGNIDSWNFNNGGNLTLTAPWGTTLSTEIGPQYRRGYSDKNMNNTEIIWDAQISHAFLKKRNLFVSAQWYDILGQQSNISRSISATMRADTETNAINSYVMFKVAYKLDLLGGRNSGGGERRGPGGQGGRGQGGPGGAMHGMRPAMIM